MKVNNNLRRLDPNIFCDGKNEEENVEEESSLAESLAVSILSLGVWHVSD